MVVGKKEKTDVKYQRKATIRISGKTFTDQDVYGDKETPKIRTVFPPSDAGDEGRLPDTARVRWMGEWYRAKLSFRYGRNNVKIPVYEFKV